MFKLLPLEFLRCVLFVSSAEPSVSFEPLADQPLLQRRVMECSGSSHPLDRDQLEQTRRPALPIPFAPARIRG